MLAPEFLVPSGILLAGTGICLCLGGLRWHYVAGLLMAAVIAAVVTTLLALPMPVALTAISIAASIGLILNRPTMIFAGGIILAIIFLVICSSVCGLYSGGEWPILQVDQDPPAVTIQQSAIFYGDWLKQTLLNTLEAINLNSALIKAIAAAVALVVIFVGIVLQKIVSALSCSVFGTVMVFAGMITLLLYKGSQPLSCIYQRPAFYSGAAVCVILFGVVVEMMLCPGKLVNENKSNKKKDGEQK